MRELTGMVVTHRYMAEADTVGSQAIPTSPSMAVTLTTIPLPNALCPLSAVGTGHVQRATVERDARETKTREKTVEDMGVTRAP